MTAVPSINLAKASAQVSNLPGRSLFIRADDARWREADRSEQSGDPFVLVAKEKLVEASVR